MLGKQTSPDVSQVRPWKLTPETVLEAVAVWPGPEGALVDWMLFPGPPEACFYGYFHAMQFISAARMQ